MEILLTGSSGFIGSALKRLLEEKGVEVIPFDIKDSTLEDVRDFSALQSKVLGINGIVHLAAVSRVKIAHENPLECVNTNIGGMINVLETARLTRKDNNYCWVIF